MVQTIENHYCFFKQRTWRSERSLTRMALANRTLINWQHWMVRALVEWVRRQGHRPLVFGKELDLNMAYCACNAFFALVRYVRDENLSVLYICGLRASLWLRLVKPFMPVS